MNRDQAIKAVADKIGRDREGPMTRRYRGIKIEPPIGKRSLLSRAIRDDLRKQSEQARRKSDTEPAKSAATSS